MTEANEEAQAPAKAFQVASQTPEGVLPRALQMLQGGIYAHSAYLVVSYGASSAFGLLFWAIAGQLYPAEAVGLAAAAIASAGFLANLAVLGLDYGLLRFLPQYQGTPDRLINSAFMLSGTLGLTVGIVFLIGIPLWSPALQLIRDSNLWAALFLGLVIAHACEVLLNGVFLSAGRTHFVLLQGAAAGLLRTVLASVFAFAAVYQLGVFGAWTASFATTVMGGLVILLKRAYPGYRLRPSWDRTVLRNMTQYSFLNYLVLLFWGAPGWLLPLIVVARLGAEANAYFYTAYLVGSTVWLAPAAVSLSLFREGAHDVRSLGVNSPHALRIMGALVVPAIVGLYLFSEPLLSMFGSQYAAEGGDVAWIVAAAAVPMFATQIYLAHQRTHRRLAEPIILVAFIAVVTLAVATPLMALQGVKGIALAVMAGHGAGGIWALFNLMKRRERGS
jgi:O-antigen/teichoic acid export membrane protein